MFLSWEVFWGGYDFGTGVHISNLYIRGYSPLFMLVLKISDNGSARYAANCLMSLAGKSPGTVALVRVYSAQHKPDLRRVELGDIFVSKWGDRDIFSF